MIVILVIALIFLGPSKLAETGRFLGKAVRELRKATTALPNMILEEDEGKPNKAPLDPSEAVGYQKQTETGQTTSKQETVDQPEDDLP